MFGLVALVGAAGCSQPAPTTAPTTAPAPLASPPPSTSPARVGPVSGWTEATPPPEIRASGTDYPAIAASLFRYRRWLLAHHPDPALADEAFAPGTMTYGEVIEQLGALTAAHQTVVSLHQRFEFETSSVHGNLMTLRLHEVIGEERVLDREGRVVRTTHFEYPNNYVVIMTNDGTGRWRLADITDIQPEPSIPL